MACGNGGGGRRFRHPQGALGKVADDATDVVALGVAGKLAGRMRRSINAFSDSKQPRVFLAKYIIWFVKHLPAVIWTGKTPSNSSRVSVTPRMP